MRKINYQEEMSKLGKRVKKQRGNNYDDSKPEVIKPAKEEKTGKNNDKFSSIMEKLIKNSPIADNKCPLADKTLRPKWECGKFERGKEPHCDNVSGYSKCPHYVKWFYWNLWRMVAKEDAKLKISEKKKEAKKKR